MSRSSVLAISRVSRRSLIRNKWQTLLIVVLIAIPVFAMTAAALVLETVAPTGTERATSRMGRADLLAARNGSDGGLTELRSALPSGSRVDEVRLGSDSVVVPGTRISTQAWFLDMDGLAAGMLVVVSGRPPGSPDEVAISAELGRHVDATIGGTLTLEGLGTVRVVGIVKDPEAIHRRLVLGDATLATSDPGNVSYLVGLPSGTSVDDAASSLAQAMPPGSDPNETAPLFYVSTREQAAAYSETSTAFVFVLGALALIEAALVAAASFAVGIRRRQRELGLLGAAGATPRQLAASVLIEGVLAGGLATIVGVALGILAAAAILPWLDDLTGRRVGPLELDAAAALVGALIGMGAALIAAAVPAWSAARLPILAALSGKRPPSAPARRWLWFGVTLIGVAIACTVVGPLVSSVRGSGLLPVLLVIGAVSGVLGFGACSPWMLERLERPARRLPLAGRIALRDTARARSRNGPIVTAVLASVAAMIALAGLLASQTAREAARWQPDMGPDMLIVGGQGAAAAGPLTAQELSAIAAGPIAAIVTPGAYPYQTLEVVTDSIAPDAVPGFFGNIVVGDESLLTALGGESALAAFRAGSTVVFPHDPEFQLGSTATLSLGNDESGQLASFQVPIQAVISPTPHWGHTPDAIMPMSKAIALGLSWESTPSQYLIRLAAPVTQGDVDRAAAIVAPYFDTTAYAALPPPDPTAPARAVLLIATLIAALSVTGVAVALGESEARPDQRSLLALGADRGLRRRITAARAAVLAALAGCLAVPAGLLPVWGVLAPGAIVVPVPEIIGAIAILPLLAMLGGLLLGRPIPEWSARRDAA